VKNLFTGELQDFRTFASAEADSTPADSPGVLSAVADSSAQHIEDFASPYWRGLLILGPAASSAGAVVYCGDPGKVGTVTKHSGLEASAATSSDASTSTCTVSVSAGSACVVVTNDSIFAGFTDMMRADE
jgi:hypothetical protein